MGLSYLFAKQRYTSKQVLFVFLITAGAASMHMLPSEPDPNNLPGGAVMTTYGCYVSGHDTSVPEGAVAPSTTPTTSPLLFGVGLGLLVANVLNDAGLGVLQQRVFAQQGRHVEESVTMMSVLGTAFMACMAGREALGFVGLWLQSPTWGSWGMGNFLVSTPAAPRPGGPNLPPPLPFLGLGQSAAR